MARVVHKDCTTMGTPWLATSTQNMNETSHSNTTSYVGIRRDKSVTICCKGIHFCCYEKRRTTLDNIHGNSLKKTLDIRKVRKVRSFFSAYRQCLRHCPYAEKTTSELRKDWTFPTLFLAKTLISHLAVVRACPEKKSEWTRHKHPT